MSRCYHLVDTKAVRVPLSGGPETSFVGHLCTWADGNPDRMVDAPRWLTKMALAGPLVTPAVECVGCPGYRANGASP